MRDCHVIDLFAGSGALGLEAVSRGAAFASFVENDSDALAVLRANIAKLRFQSSTAVMALLNNEVSSGQLLVAHISEQADNRIRLFV